MYIQKASRNKGITSGRRNKIPYALFYENWSYSRFHELAQRKLMEHIFYPALRGNESECRCVGSFVLHGWHGISQHFAGKRFNIKYMCLCTNGCTLAHTQSGFRTNDFRILWTCFHSGCQNGFGFC